MEEPISDKYRKRRILEEASEILHLINNMMKTSIKYEHPKMLKKMEKLCEACIIELKTPSPNWIYLQKLSNLLLKKLDKLELCRFSIN